MSENNSPSGNSTPIIVALLAIGAAFVTVLGSALTNEPHLIIPLIFVLGVVALILVLMAGVWDRISDRLSSGVARSIVRQIDGPKRRNFRDAYFKYLYYSHRTFDIRGLSTQGVYALDLEQIFIDLSIAPDTKLPESPIPSELTTGGHSIWEYLMTPNPCKLVLIGTPGGGKTTLLKHITLTLASPSKRREEQIPKHLPVLLFLRDHVETIVTNPKIRLTKIISASLELMDEELPEDWFEELLDNGKCVVMLDGLDEVADAGKRQIIVTWVDLQMKVYGGCRFILTSRPHGYRSNPLSGVTQLVVRPFSRDQVERFVHSWYLANEAASYQKLDKGVELAAITGARDLLKRIYAAHDIADLAVNPLLLTMIATLHKYRSSLPGRRVELYAEICEVLLGRKDQSSGLAVELTPAQKISVLQPLAFTMMERKTREISLDEAAELIAAPLKLVTSDMRPVDFLELIRNRSGILIEREQGYYGFSHKTFQEYLSAVHIQVEKLHEVLVLSIDNPWWTETIRLYCARADATAIIEQCLQDAPPSIDRLTLAIECDYEALKLDPGVRERLRDIIEADLDSEDMDRLRIAAGARLALRLKRLIRLDDARYADMSDIPVTNAEYQLFLDASATKEGTLDHWNAPHFPIGTGRLPVMGIKPEQATQFCKWLSEHSTDIEVEYRLPRSNECVFNGSYWVQDNSYDVTRYTLAGKQSIDFPWREWLLAEDLPQAKLTGALTDSIMLSGYQPQLAIEPYARIHALSCDESLDSSLRYINKHAHELDADLGLDFDRVIASAVDFAHNTADVRTHALARDLIKALERILHHKNVNVPVQAYLETLVHSPDFRTANSLADALEQESSTNTRAEVTLAAKTARLVAGCIDLAIIQEGLESGNVIASLNRAGTLSAFRQSLLENIEYFYTETAQRMSRANQNESKRETWNNELHLMKMAYATLALLERRRTGEWQPIESIRFVREQKQTLF